MKIIELDKNSLQQIKNLWEELNVYLGTKSTYFAAHYTNCTFEQRTGKLLKKEKLKCFLAQKGTCDIGYCIATLDAGEGEIDSIYVRPEYRNNKVGTALLQRALNWLKDNKCREINIFIAEGNEAVLDFYAKHQFYKRSMVAKYKAE